MRIAIDVNDILHGQRAIRRYVCELVRLLATVSSQTHYSLFYCRFRKPHYPMIALPPDGGSVMTAKAYYLPGGLLSKCWERFGFPDTRCLLGPMDLYHAPGSLIPPRGRIPNVITVHSMAHEIIPEQITASVRQNAKRLADRIHACGDYFITVSEDMKKIFQKTYGVSAHRVRAIPLGVSSEFHPREPAQVRDYLKRQFGLEGRYVLYVGGIQRHKNVQGIVHAFRRLREQGFEDLLLVLAGDHTEESGSIIDLIAKLGLEYHVRVLGYRDPDSEELAFLYCGAAVFIFPTFYEGWSSPPLEAMVSGVPVVASDIAPHHENLGQAAVLVPPEDPDAIANAIGEFLSEPEKAQAYRNRGRDHARAWTWKRTAEKTFLFYRDIAAARKGG